MPRAIPLQQTSDLTEPDTRLHGHYLWLTRAAWLVVFLLVLSMVIVNIPHLLSDTRQEWQVGEALVAARSIYPSINGFVRYVVVLKLIAASVFAGTAVFIAWRRSDDWMALFTSAALLLLVYLFGFGLDVDIIRYPTFLERSLPIIRMVVPTLIIGCLIGLFFLFPDGRFYPRWIVAVAVPAFLLTASVFYEAFNPAFDLSPPFLGFLPDEWGWLISVCTLLATLIIGLISRIAYYRRQADVTQRRQIKLVLFGLGALIAVPFLMAIFDVLDLFSKSWGHFIALHLEILLPIILPITIGMSVLRYRLWEVDILVSRTLIYGGLTALIILLYVLVVGVLGALFQSANNLVFSVLATGLIAVLFNPLRHALQRTVNRLLYGQRDDPLKVLADLGKQLENTAVPSESLPALVETLALTLKLPYVAILGNEDDVIAETGVNSEPPMQTYPLMYQAVSIGRLRVAPRSTGEPFTADEERLLQHVARQAGSAVYAYQLTNQLQRSRERLVSSREEERRRLRRDLHDGLGPQLATLTIKVSAAENLLGTDLEGAQKLMAEIKSESQSAIQEIRRVVEDLRPSTLDQLGLLSALREFVAQNGNGRINVTLDAPDQLPSLPAAVEVAAYRIVTEAVTNTVRHANAQSCKVTLTLNDNLYLEIFDDGDGLSGAEVPGVGLNSMQERAVELGGTFEVKSAPGKGTKIMVDLPMMGSR